MERLLDFNVSISNGNIKYPIGKSNFAVNLPLKLFPSTIANADIESQKSLHTFLKKCLYHMPVKFGPNYTHFWAFLNIFHCSKNCGSLTCVTRLKVALNMADLFSIQNSDSHLNTLTGWLTHTHTHGACSHKVLMDKLLSRITLTTWRT